MADKPKWNSFDIDDRPEWLAPGCRVNHSIFGQGVVVEWGEYKKGIVLVIDFEVGRKVLHPEHAIPQLTPQGNPEGGGIDNSGKGIISKIKQAIFGSN